MQKSDSAVMRKLDSGVLIEADCSQRPAFYFIGGVPGLHCQTTGSGAGFGCARPRSNKTGIGALELIRK